jgi:hypothetical protein
MKMNENENNREGTSMPSSGMNNNKENNLIYFGENSALLK